jgi:hypothetical protein
MARRCRNWQPSGFGGRPVSNNIPVFGDPSSGKKAKKSEIPNQNQRPERSPEREVRLRVVPYYAVEVVDAPDFSGHRGVGPTPEKAIANAKGMVLGKARGWKPVFLVEGEAND